MQGSGELKDESIVEHRLYFIKDEFFDLVADPYLKRNKSTTKRPHYYALKDPQTSLLWMIPCSTQIDKYKGIIAEREARNVPHNHIQIIWVNGRERAFLYQDMFPVIPDYVESVYANATGIFEIKDRKDIEQVQENAIKIIKLLRHGVSFTPTQPDIGRVEGMMVLELQKRGGAG